LSSDPSEQRSAATAVVQAPWGAPLRVVGTHLDHKLERHRLDQLHEIERSLEAGLNDGILMGDLNALHEADYTAWRWEDIQRIRLVNGLPPAQTHLTDDLFGRMALGDAAQASKKGTEPTSRYGTRVDYVLKGAAVRAEFAPGSYRVWRVIDLGISDDNAVVVDITKPAESSKCHPPRTGGA